MYLAKPLVGLVADVRRVLEESSVVGLIDEHGDRELVGVKVPRELLARVQDVGRQPRERIGITEELRNLETVSQEAGQVGGTKDRVGCTIRLPRVSGNEAARSLDEGVQRMPLGVTIVGVDMEVRIDRLGREVGCRFSGGYLLMYNKQ